MFDDFLALMIGTNDSCIDSVLKRLECYFPRSYFVKKFKSGRYFGTIHWIPFWVPCFFSHYFRNYGR